MGDILSACQYFTKAIEIQPESKQLRDHSLLFRKSRRVNIYHELTKEVQSALQLGATIYDDDKIAVLKNTLELCRKNCTDSSPLSASSRAQPRRSQWSNTNKNYDRGSSSHVQSNWREERASSSPKGFSQDYSSRRNDELNSPKRHFGSPNERNYTSWRSEMRENQESRSEFRTSNTFRNKEDSPATNRMRDGDFRQSRFSQPRHNNDGSQADASHNLVENVKDLNL